MKFPRLEYRDYVIIRCLMEDVEQLTQQELASLEQLKRVIAAVERVRKSKGMGKCAS